MSNKKFQREYGKWPYKLSYSSMLTWKKSHRELKGISKLPVKKQVGLYIKLGLGSHQTFFALLRWQGGKAIRLAHEALQKMGED